MFPPPRPLYRWGMGSNSTPRADRNYCLGRSLSEFPWHVLELDCGELGCPRGRTYVVTARPITLGDYPRRLRCRGCGRAPTTALLVGVELPRHTRVWLIGNGGIPEAEMTARIQLAHGQMVRVFCAECGHESRLDLEDIIARGLAITRCRSCAIAAGPRAWRQMGRLFTCGGTQVRFIIQPAWRERPR